MSDLKQAKIKLTETINRYNSTVNNTAKFHFNKEETELFAKMMVEFSKEHNVSSIFEQAIENIDSNGLECGIEDIGITCRYQAVEYGFEQCKERVLEAIENLS